MGNENNENSKYWNSFKNALLILSLITSILALFLNVLATPDAISKFWIRISSFFTARRVQLLINIGNIVISGYFLLVFLLSSKISAAYNIRWGEKDYDFCELAELERDVEKRTITAKSQETLKGYQNRVAALVIQYLWMVRYFAISLVFVYLAIISSSIATPQEKADYRPITNFALTINIFNFLGGIVIFLAFWVLYSDTLNKHDKDNRFWVIPAVFAGIYLVLFFSLSWLFPPDTNAYFFLNRFDLFAGLINGLAMFLLFGRYVSLEQSLSKTELFKVAFRDLFKPLPIFKNEEIYKKIVSFSIIFLLPIYALAQPQFGALQIPVYGDPIVFQTMVYGTCLVGKFFFFHLTYLLISKKLLHLYLYGLVSKVGNFRKLEECLTGDSAET